MPATKKSLEAEDHQRDADFNKALHGKSALAKGGMSAMFTKDREAKKLAVDEYFKHFDNKTAEAETTKDREVCCVREALQGWLRQFPWSLAMVSAYWRCCRSGYAV